MGILNIPKVSFQRHQTYNSAYMILFYRSICFSIKLKTLGIYIFWKQYALERHAWSAPPTTSITPQATRPPAFPVFLLPSSASPVPLKMIYAQFSCALGKRGFFKTHVPRSSEPAWITIARPAMSLEKRLSQLCQNNRTHLSPPSPRVRSVSTRSMLVSPKRGVAMFPKSPAWLSLGSQERITWNEF